MIIIQNHKKKINFLIFNLQKMEMTTMSKNRERDHEERRYSVPQGPYTPLPPTTSEDLHAWSIYR